MDIKLVALNHEAVNRANYEELYHAAYNQLTNLHDSIEKVQQDLEAMYLQQTESAAPSLYVMKKQEEED